MTTESAVEELWQEIEAVGGPMAVRVGLAQRMSFVERFSWAVPSREAIAEIIRFAAGDLILEVCAGRGLWARLIEGAGGRIIATDEEPGWESRTEGRSPTIPTAIAEARRCFTDVEPLDAVAAVRAHPEARVLMMVWPPYDDPMDFEVLDAFDGDRLIYVGELGDCTGSAAGAARIEAEWEEEQQIWIPQWPGCHDSMTLWRRR